MCALGLLRIIFGLDGTVKEQPLPRPESLAVEGEVSIPPATGTCLFRAWPRSRLLSACIYFAGSV